MVLKTEGDYQELDQDQGAMEENRVGGTMKPFRISATATIASKKIAVIIDGPGIEPGGLRREFSSKTEAHDF